MKKITRILTALLLLTLAANFVSCAKEQGSEGATVDIVKMNIAAGSLTGNYYNVGQALSTILKKQNIELKVEETDGTLENVDLMLQERADLSITMIDAASEAYKRTETSDSAIGTDLRVMMKLYPKVVQAITIEDTGIKSIKDLKYKRIGVSLENSGVESNIKAIFEAHEISFNDCEIKTIDVNDATSLLEDGELDAVIVTGTIPNSMIVELEKEQKDNLVFIPIEGIGRQELTKNSLAFEAITIPVNSYGRNEEIETISVWNVILVNKNVKDDVVEAILKTIESHMVELEAAIGIPEMISLENPESITEIPLHPGAKKYFDNRSEI